MSLKMSQKSFDLFLLFQRYSDVADGFRGPSMVSVPVLWQHQTVEADPEAVNFRGKADTSSDVSELKLRIRVSLFKVRNIKKASGQDSHSPRLLTRSPLIPQNVPT